MSIKEDREIPLMAIVARFRAQRLDSGLSGNRGLTANLPHAPATPAELAVLYSFTFLFIAAYGSGIWSVDGAKTSTA